MVPPTERSTVAGVPVGAPMAAAIGPEVGVASTSTAAYDRWRRRASSSRASRSASSGAVSASSRRRSDDHPVRELAVAVDHPPHGPLDRDARGQEQQRQQPAGQHRAGGDVRRGVHRPHRAGERGSHDDQHERLDEPAADPRLDLAEVVAPRGHRDTGHGEPATQQDEHVLAQQRRAGEEVGDGAEHQPRADAGADTEEGEPGGQHVGPPAGPQVGERSRSRAGPGRWPRGPAPRRTPAPTAARSAESGRPENAATQTAYPTAGAVSSAAITHRPRPCGRVRSATASISATRPRAAIASPTAAGQVPRAPARSTTPRPSGVDVSVAGSSASGDEERPRGRCRRPRPEDEGAQREQQDRQEHHVRRGPHRGGERVAVQRDVDLLDQVEAHPGAADLVAEDVAHLTSYAVEVAGPSAQSASARPSTAWTSSPGRSAVSP